MPRVDEQEGRRILLEHGRSDLVERRFRPGLSLSKACREAIARQVDDVYRRSLTAGDTIDVRQPRLAGRPARARDGLPDKGVDQARFADIRSPHQRDFRQALLREVGRGGGTCDELSGNLQWVIVSSMTALSTGSACASAGRRPASGSASAIFKTSSIVWTR